MVWYQRSGFIAAPSPMHQYLLSPLSQARKRFVKKARQWKEVPTRARRLAREVNTSCVHDWTVFSSNPNPNCEPKRS